jgi:hypothetical protein
MVLEDDGSILDKDVLDAVFTHNGKIGPIMFLKNGEEWNRGTSVILDNSQLLTFDIVSRYFRADKWLSSYSRYLQSLSVTCCLCDLAADRYLDTGEKNQQME